MAFSVEFQYYRLQSLEASVLLSGRRKRKGEGARGWLRRAGPDRDRPFRRGSVGTGRTLGSGLTRRDRPSVARRNAGRRGNLGSRATYLDGGGRALDKCGGTHA